MNERDPPGGNEGLPPGLRTLLDAADAGDGDVERAWASFVERHSRLLLHVSHESATSHDGAMDRYAYLLQRLREQDFQRLRRYRANGRGRFTTWLVVVARRLCVDFHRL